jgi:hypothetical protein
MSECVILFPRVIGLTIYPYHLLLGDTLSLLKSICVARKPGKELENRVLVDKHAKGIQDSLSDIGRRVRAIRQFGWRGVAGAGDLRYAAVVTLDVALVPSVGSRR